MIEVKNGIVKIHHEHFLYKSDIPAIQSDGSVSCEITHNIFSNIGQLTFWKKIKMCLDFYKRLSK